MLNLVTKACYKYYHTLLCSSKNYLKSLITISLLVIQAASRINKATLNELCLSFSTEIRGLNFTNSVLQKAFSLLADIVIKVGIYQLEVVLVFIILFC